MDLRTCPWYAGPYPAHGGIRIGSATEITSPCSLKAEDISCVSEGPATFIFVCRVSNVYGMPRRHFVLDSCLWLSECYPIVSLSRILRSPMSDRLRYANEAAQHAPH